VVVIVFLRTRRPSLSYPEMSDLAEPVLLAGLDGISALGVFDLDGRRSGWTSEGLGTRLSMGE
jgi:hypothetical protein